jgi:hypothetical protein
MGSLSRTSGAGANLVEDRGLRLVGVARLKRLPPKRISQTATQDLQLRLTLKQRALGTRVPHDVGGFGRFRGWLWLG